VTLCVNDSGTWREISTLCINDSGTWRNVSTGCINQSGTWREFGFGPDIPGTPLGTCIEGGYLICKSAGVGWLLAPVSTQVGRSWYSRDDAVTTAQANAPCGDWFVPTCGQLQNPGYACRTYWDTYSLALYWTSTEVSAGNANTIYFSNDYAAAPPKTLVRCVRAFRCVSY